MADIEAVVQIFERYALEKPFIPDLSEDEKTLFDGTHTHLETVQWKVLVLVNDTGNAV